MDAIECLLHRVSSPRLDNPAPTSEQQSIIYRSAFRAADHAALRPWRFLTVSGDARVKLGQLFCDAAASSEGVLSVTRKDKLLGMPLRAPLIVVVIARCSEHTKVPPEEMMLSAGAASQNMLNAAFALGVGAIWRTGEMAYHPLVRHGLGITAEEHIVGYIYLGTSALPLRRPSEPSVGDFFTPWGID